MLLVCIALCGDKKVRAAIHVERKTRLKPYLGTPGRYCTRKTRSGASIILPYCVCFFTIESDTT